MDFAHAILWLVRTLDAMAGWHCIVEVAMVFNRRHLLGTGCATLSTLLAPKFLAASHADAGKYPAKPVRVIVLFAFCVSFDLLARNFVLCLLFLLCVLF